MPRIGRLLAVHLLSAMLSGCGDDAPSTPSSTAEAELVEAGWSFGFCLGPCAGTLEVSGSELHYRISNRTGDEIFTKSGGELTPEGTRRLTGLVSELPGELRETYGCPDCADAGAAYVVLSLDGDSRRSNYEHPSPPEELGALHGFLQSVMEALESCRSTAELSVTGDCTPFSR